MKEILKEIILEKEEEEAKKKKKNYVLQKEESQISFSANNDKKLQNESSLSEQTIDVVNRSRNQFTSQNLN